LEKQGVTLLDNLLLLDHLPESAELGDKATETHGEIVDSFTFHETDALKLRPEPLCPCIPDSLAADPQRPDCLPRLCGGRLNYQLCQHLLRHRAGDGVQRHSVFLQRDISGSMASQRLLGCSLIFMINAQFV
jgi:hypothetical protein